MIDEDLYQQAADELNSDKRRPALWARACALASDDHDEARFLYTNLRVEELLEESKTRQAANPSIDDDADNDATLALEPIDETVVEELVGFLNDDFKLSEDFDPEEKPQSVSAPSGMDNNASNNDVNDFIEFGESAGAQENAPASSPAGIGGSDTKDGFLNLEPPESLSKDPDATLMEDYVPDQFDVMDDTYEGTEAIAGDDVADAIAAHALQPDEPPGQDDLIANGRAGINPVGIAVETSNPDEEQSSDFTQANVQMFDEHTNEMDEMLARSQHAQTDQSLDRFSEGISDEIPDDISDHVIDAGEGPAIDEDASWLDDDDIARESSESGRTPEVIDDVQDPVVYEEDPFTNELNRQADELGLNAPGEELASMKSDLEDQARDFEQPSSNTDEFSLDEDNRQEASNASGSAASQAHDQDSDSSISVVGAGATAAVAAASIAASAPDLSAPLRSDTDQGDTTSCHSNSKELELPLDLTEGRKGREYSIYRRDVKAQAVKSGVSWSALFFTFPYLIYRQLFGTAFAYALLWIISLGGLLLSGLAWIDAGTEVTPLTQACTIGFALLAFIGLMYLPFRYGNAWRAEKLENRGFELVAVAKATNPGKAIARARRHAALFT